MTRPKIMLEIFAERIFTFRVPKFIISNDYNLLYINFILF